MQSGKQVGVRLDDTTIGRLRALQPELSTRGRAATLSETVRAVLCVGLNVVDEQGVEILEELSEHADESETTHDHGERRR